MRFTYAELSFATLQTLIHLDERGMTPAYWDQLTLPLTPQEQQAVAGVTTYLLNYQLNLMNEATIWSRAIYPLLLLAEMGTVQAWAQVPLKATFPHFTLEGLLDGVLGHAPAGMITAPFLIVVEAKRGLEAQNPQYQLYGALLAAAWHNQQRLPDVSQTIYGCYTIGDNWTFVHGEVTGFEADRPTLTVRFSREYAERLEATTILGILKGIVRAAERVQLPQLA